MMVHLLRRWPYINSALGQHLVLSESGAVKSNIPRADRNMVMGAISKKTYDVYNKGTRQTINLNGICI